MKFLSKINFYGKRFFLVLSLLIMIGSLAIALQTLPQKTQLSQKAQTLSSPPQKVRISNITPNSFTVSWVTSHKVSGAVIYGENKENVENKSTVSPKQVDERGENAISYTHSVTIGNLNPGSKYYFKILSGNKTYLSALNGNWAEIGIAESVILPYEFSFSPDSPISSSNTPGSFSGESLAFAPCSNPEGQVLSSCFRPNLIYGQVINEDSSIFPEALVYVEVPEKSNLLSVLASEDGRWALSLANFLKSDLSGRLSYLPGIDLLRIRAVGSPSREAILYEPIPFVTKLFQDQPKPILLTLLSLPDQPTITETTTSTASITPTPRPTSPPPLAKLNLSISIPGKNGEKCPTRNANFFINEEGSSPITQKIRLIPKNDQYTATIAFQKIGDYSFALHAEGYLKQNLGSTTIEKGDNSFNPKVTLLAGDLDNNNVVNALDLSLLLKEINQKTPRSFMGDFDCNGLINDKDLAILTANYRKKGN